jgi:hypothetical protein
MQTQISLIFKFLLLLPLLLVSHCNHPVTKPRTSYVNQSISIQTLVTIKSSNASLYNKYVSDNYGLHRSAQPKPHSKLDVRCKDDSDFKSLIKHKFVTKTTNTSGIFVEASKSWSLEPTALLIEEIGSDFVDSLVARGFSDSNYKLIVTSIFRTSNDVKKLKKSNPIATTDSTHEWGISFDIAYRRFKRSSSSSKVDTQLLYNILVNVLVNKRKENKCYVLHEFSQSCFHVTVRLP